MAWENQYIQLVTTKPGVIVAESDKELAPETVQSIRSRQREFERCFVELGSGSGMHLLKLAVQNPKSLCVGFEIRFKRAFRTGEKAESRGLSNVMLVRTDARNLSTIFEPGSVDAFFINYPDPWDKRRWRKNRLINEELLSTMWERLKPSGFVRYKTDHHEYFSSTMALVTEERWEIRRNTTDLFNSPFADGNIPTEFELLFKSQSKPLCLSEFVKR